MSSLITPPVSPTTEIKSLSISSTSHQNLDLISHLPSPPISYPNSRTNSLSPPDSTVTSPRISSSISSSIPSTIPSIPSTIASIPSPSVRIHLSDANEFLSMNSSSHLLISPSKSPPSIQFLSRTDLKKFKRKQPYPSTTIPRLSYSPLLWSSASSSASSSCSSDSDELLLPSLSNKEGFRKESFRSCVYELYRRNGSKSQYKIGSLKGLNLRRRASSTSIFIQNSNISSDSSLQISPYNIIPTISPRTNLRRTISTPADILKISISDSIPSKVFPLSNSNSTPSSSSSSSISSFSRPSSLSIHTPFNSISLSNSHSHSKLTSPSSPKQSIHLTPNLNDHLNIHTNLLSSFNARAKIHWKGPSLPLANLPFVNLMHSTEIQVSSILRLTPEQYLLNKLLILEGAHAARNRGASFRKSDAQKCCRIDVNKASRLWEFFGAVGWL